jgi:hypothetical protein
MTMTLIQSVRDIAGKYPDAIYIVEEIGYPQYTKGDCGPGSGCLLGQAMQACGMEDIAAQSDESGEQSIPQLFNELGVTSKNDQLWLINVQCYQDLMRTWREAVRLADSLVGAN